MLDYMKNQEKENIHKLIIMYFINTHINKKNPKKKSDLCIIV